MNWYDEYLARYKKLKEVGKPFFPFAVFKDALMAFVILGVLCWLALHYGASLEDVADPTDSTYNPRPEWYFLFLFQALKLFPGNMESVAAVVLPGAAVIFLFALPFLDRGPERHPLSRPFFTLLGVLTLAGIGYLTYLGATSPLTNPIVEKDPAIERGKRLYNELNCAYCHKVGGKGGNVGPELDKIEATDTKFLREHFQDPQKATPGSAMPKLNLLEDEIDVLIAYIQSLGAGQPYTEEAPRLFKENCSACHKIGEEGNEVGPDLTMVSQVRNRGYVKHYIEDPAKMNADSSMPGFMGQLTDTQIEDLTRYIMRLKR